MSVRLPSVTLTRRETFSKIMRNNAMEDAAAEESDDSHEALNFHEFCQLVRDREVGDHTQQELRKRFRALDITGSGTILTHEYLRLSLRDALARSCTRIAEIMEAWDVDHSGDIDIKEFKRAVRALGFDDVRDKQIEQIFRELDEDSSGQVCRHELEKRLRKYAGVAVEQKHELRRIAGGRKGAALAASVRLDASSDTPMPVQLRDLLAKNSVRVIDLFRDWDEDGNGLVDRMEFYKAIIALGIKVPRKDSDALFDLFDSDGSGSIAYREMNKHLRRRVVAEKGMRRSASDGPRLLPPGPSRGLFRALSPIQGDRAEQALATAASNPLLGVASSIQRFGTSGLGSKPFQSTVWPQRVDLTLLADMWLKPRHGQEWRMRRQLNILPALRR